VLWGYRLQTQRGFELVVADDGSGPEVACLLEAFRQREGLVIAHVWQPREGFRKCQILNQAILQARGEYLIFSDGDCVPDRDFVATHLGLARPGFGLSGGCIRLPMSLSQRLNEHDLFSGRCRLPLWLWQHGMRSLTGLRKLSLAGMGLGAWADFLTPTQATFNGHNASVWREDALRVNGFDERLVYGGLDREFGERLHHAGVRFRQVRHQAVCFHLEHARPYVNAAGWQQNRAIREATRRSKRAWTQHGIEQPGRVRPPVPLAG
jgi:glycosyltransferase involved in cell wall biosynthesis